ncbi:PAP2 superfamily protein [Dokdonia sp. MED134]|uniref:vanadium-dependent haloperoxidase n=1 Tax=Dokdonia sp. MED134 TaxID=313590 RepID=UPI000068BF89|nr:vanadium-dependent haloperoxidase [Dokdonia sp. MED134]EAQ38179.1 PAP2 superfamily protein [Dokdonia sp. MED134]
MKTQYTLIVLLTALITLSSCSKKSEPIVITPDHFHNAIDKVTEVIIHDIFSPPVASRIYAYPNIAAYEILAVNNPSFTSLSGQLTNFTAIPAPAKDASINYELAALVAHMDMSKRLIFSEQDIEVYRDSLYAGWQELNEEEFVQSRDYGLQVSNHIAAWMDGDNYKQTRTMPKFSVRSDEPSRWQPTPPAYMDGIEPHWNKIRPFVINTADQFKPVPPPAFSLEEDSDFYKELKEVYDISQQITKDGDTSEEIAIAQFWDCNPYVSVTRGHLMFATKKITPGGHWVGITKIASKKAGLDVVHTLHAYTKTTIAMYDAFISCWDEKYRSNLIRPETLINDHIDDSWKPILQTPPFPEYVSGHSVVSGAAAESLTSIFGDNFSFNDDTEIAYGLPIRNFKSFRAAAQEAAISRMYGGIHYRAAVEIGLNQGKDLGQYVVSQLDMKTETGVTSN